MVEMTGRRRLVLVALWLLVAAAAAEWLVRGTLRGLRDSSDYFKNGYCASAAWLQGKDPYGVDDVAEIWSQTGSYLGLLTQEKRPLYPPPTLVLIAPYAAQPCWASHVTWQVTLHVLALLAIGALVVDSQFARDDPRLPFLIAALAALAPLHSGLAKGQLAVASISCTILAIVAYGRERPNLSGVLLGIATALKPQLGLAFTGYFVLRGRWRPATWALAITAVCGAIAIGRMALAGVDWVPSYLDNYHWFNDPDRNMDAGRGNPYRYMLINLQMALFGWTESRAAVQAIALSATAALSLTYIALLRRVPRDEFLASGLVGVLCLLPVYHSNYDALVLALPVTWAVRALASEHRRFAIATLAISALFLFPGGAAVHVLGQRLPDATTSSWWWQGLLLPFWPWALLVISIVLLAALRSGLVEGRGAPETARP
jgi:hypothetical protein